MSDTRCGAAAPDSGRYRLRRRVFFRRFAALAIVVAFLGVFGLLTLGWMAATGLGLVDASTPVATPIRIGAALFAGLVVLRLIGFGRRFGFPLREVMEAADRVASGDYSVRVGVEGPPPIRALARSFNTMTERLAKNDQLRRNLMADVAHELRTPLTVIQGRVEGLLDGVYARDDASLEQVLEETQVLSRLIEDLRTLALSEAGVLELQREATDLTALAREAAQAFAAQAAGQGVTMNVNGAASVIAEVDPVRIREVLANLLSNSLRHTGTGGTVTLGVAQPEKERASVTVTDTGAGMTAEETRHAFERFYKGPGSRGSGLGLAIAQGLVAAHGGSIGLTSEPGRGTTIVFTIPT